MQQRKSVPASIRFWRHVDKTGECWLWTGAKAGKGYGNFKDRSWHLVYAHRFSYEMAYGPISDGLLVCHRCDTPHCVRPDHLFLGTVRENAEDMASKGRAPRGGPNGERSGNTKLSDAQVEEMRRMFGTGTPYGELARHFGIGKSQVARIVRNMSRKQPTHW